MSPFSGGIRKNKTDIMTINHTYEVIILGGSYAGLSAAMSLGRSLRRVLILDNGKPCNRQTPHSHNFLTQDGIPPEQISQIARSQVLAYETVTLIQTTATDAVQTETGFEITAANGEYYTAGKLVIATGIREILPEIPGMESCWGFSVIHCPYCHGFEFRKLPTAILGNSEYLFEFSKMVRNLTPHLTLLTGGTTEFATEDAELLQNKGIRVEHSPVKELLHWNGQLEQILLHDGTLIPCRALYLRPSFELNSSIPEKLGGELTDQGHLKVDFMQQTSVPGMYACGDCCSPMRSVSNAVATGALSGAAINRALCEEEFKG